jgi:Fe-S cluster assembly iron-binding protein IscA
MTDTAAAEIRSLVDRPDVPDDGGVRISGGVDGSLQLALTAGPVEGDQVVDHDGARVFLEPQVGELLADKKLDAAVSDQGSLQFSITEEP